VAVTGVPGFAQLKGRIDPWLVGLSQGVQIRRLCPYLKCVSTKNRRGLTLMVWPKYG